MNLTFATSNTTKWKIAQAVLGQYGVTLTHEAIETPEIQTLNVEEVAAFSAEYAASKLNQPVMVTDVGYYISALNGFPGPFIKFINQTLTSENILNLMQGQTNREVIILECLAYARPNKKTATFTSRQYGHITHTVQGNGTAVNNVMILKGFNQAVSQTPHPQLEAYWHENLSHYHTFGKSIARL